VHSYFHVLSISVSSHFSLEEYLESYSSFESGFLCVDDS